MSRCRRHGQGVVEYSGALVIAALIVATGLTVLPPQLAAYLSSIQAGILQFLLTKMPA